MTVSVTTDTNPRIRIDGGGRITWGSGSAAGDVYIERTDVSTITVSGELRVNSAFYVDSIGISPTGATTGQVLQYNGTKFVPATVSSGGASVSVSDTSPSSPSQGNLWYESDTGIMYIRYDNFWVEISGADGSFGDIMTSPQSAAIFAMEIGP